MGEDAGETIAGWRYAWMMGYCEHRNATMSLCWLCGVCMLIHFARGDDDDDGWRGDDAAGSECQGVEHGL